MRLLGWLTIIVVGAAVLGVGSCQLQRVREKQAIRAKLPLPYQDGHFTRFDVCDRLFGGGSYIFQLSPKAAQHLLHDAMRNGSPSGSSGELWSREGPPAGLLCLNIDSAEQKRLRYHANRLGSWSRQTASRTFDYFIPTLGIVVGGSDPR